MTINSASDLETADLVVDALYCGYRTEKGGTADPLVKLLGVSRQGGFRYRGTYGRPTLLALTSNLAEPDWPDELDLVAGRFVYYGDNRKPGLPLHDTPRFGNLLLKNLFDMTHADRRAEIPPILIFTSESPGRSFRFRGLAVPGHPTMPATEDLVAIWKTSGNQRFQNYRAVFTILDAATISRKWIHTMGAGERDIDSAPLAWQVWAKTGNAKPLESPRTQPVRSKSEQLPTSDDDWALIDTIKERYRGRETAFEPCAGAITKLLLGSDVRLDLTRPWRDGGRDGIGQVRLGRGPASIGIAFALEAKCYGRRTSVGVRDISRLISRIKHREFGVLVTTSFVHDQAYKEVVDDGHPVILVTALDIVRLLRDAGYTTPALVSRWLDGFVMLGG